MRVLVLVAHPDDEVILCGATIDKLVKKGHEVFVTFYTRNDEAYFGNESQVERRARAVREAKQSSRLFGFTSRQLAYRDMDLAKDKGALIRTTIQEIRATRPDVIITEHELDRHTDHAALGVIVPEANFQSGNELCGGTDTWAAPLVLQGEVNLEMTMPFAFTMVSAISQKNLERKIEGFQIYESVMTEHGTEQDWLLTKIHASAQLRGHSANGVLGEAFVMNAYVPLSSRSLHLAAEVAEL